MQVKAPYKIVLLVRGEGSKVPAAVLPHEIDILKAIHGEDAVIETEDKPPVPFEVFDAEEKFAEARDRFKGNSELPDPVGQVFRNLNEFKQAYADMEVDGEPGGDDDVPSDDEVKAALIAEAKELGITKANKSWGIAKLEQAIEEAKAEKGEE